LASAGVEEGERKGTDVDDLVAVLQKGFGLVGKVVCHAGERRAVGLVDVHATDGAAQGGGGVAGALADVLGLAADSVVEDEDARCAGSRYHG
jgi:hypothetical protein